MGTWNSRGLRGSTLEDMINYTNTRYEEMGLALIQKVPTPITPVRIDKERRHITLAYFDKVSTVDYIGAVQGIPICFDAKECAADTFPLQNVHEHQVSFMEKYEKQQGNYNGQRNDSNVTCRRAGLQTVCADPEACKTGSSIWRKVPNHRLSTFKLRKFRY